MSATRTVDVGRHYTVHVGPGVLEHARSFCEQYRRVFVLSDENVARLHGDRVRGWPHSTLHVVPAGERSKDFATLERVLEAMVQAGLDRKCALVAFGGGVVGDLGGLAASLCLRGIDCVQAPTSLLAMVDSSVGGKTAVNLPGGKNLAGTFHHPRAVYADTELLATLPDEELRAGFGEVLKTAVLDGDLLPRILGDAAALRARQPDALADVVHACVALKGHVVARDPHEAGPRKVLNLGHTFAHAIEHVAGFGVVPHGVAVAVGVGLAVRLALVMEKLSSPTLAADCERAARALGLPTSLRELGVALPEDALLSAMRVDKKNRDGSVRFVLPLAPGQCMRDVEAGDEVVLGVLRASGAAPARGR
jgi:3-dehydroquinate synthase